MDLQSLSMSISVKFFYGEFFRTASALSSSSSSPGRFKKRQRQKKRSLSRGVDKLNYLIQATVWPCNLFWHITPPENESFASCPRSTVTGRQGDNPKQTFPPIFPRFSGVGKCWALHIHHVGPFHGCQSSDCAFTGREGINFANHSITGIPRFIVSSGPNWW